MINNIWITSQNNKSIKDDIIFAKNNWFNSYSLNLSYRYNLNLFTDEDLFALNSFVDDEGIFIIHMPYYLPINTCITEVFNWVIDYFIQVIEKFHGHWLSIISIHGWYIENKDNNKESFIKNINKLLTITDKYNIELSIENDDLWIDYPFCQIRDFQDIKNEAQKLKYCFDIWHAHTTGENIIKFYNEIADKINIIHLHNNFWKDTHNNLDNWNIDIQSILCEINKRTPSIIIILELNWYKNLLDWKKMIENSFNTFPNY